MCEEALAKFMHEMGGTAAAPQAKLLVTASSLPAETPRSCLESRGKRSDAASSGLLAIEDDPPALDDGPHRFAPGQ